MPGNWHTFKAPPSVSADTMLLMTDGSVLVHNADGSSGRGTGGRDWYRLTPDASGSYRNGIWSDALSMATERQFFASGVLRDGRVYAVGGEYATGFGDDGCALGEIFDPRPSPASPWTGQWLPMDKPSPQFDFVSGDCPSTVLADGRVLFGGPGGRRTAIWNPARDKWTEAGLGLYPAGAQARKASSLPGAQTKKGRCSEETWTLLPNGNVLTVQISGTTVRRNAEQYVPSIDKWVSAGKTTRKLAVRKIKDYESDEIGPAILLPSGKVVAFGGNGRTEIYTPDPDPRKAGSWVAGPGMPADPGNPLSKAGLLTVLDGAAVLLPGGKVICTGGRTTPEVFHGKTSYWSKPTRFLAYDPAAATLRSLGRQPGNNGDYTFTGSLLLLPNGHVLYATEDNTMAEYTPTARELAADPSWRPAIANCPDVLAKGRTYLLAGTQFNGLSQANSYGDDRQCATNYPIFRLTNDAGQVRYLRSADFSTMGVATGEAMVTAQIEVPDGVGDGDWDLVVIANGIASEHYPVRVAGSPGAP